MGGLFSAIARLFGGQQATENPVFEAINERERIEEEEKRQAALAELERLRSAAEREAQEAREAKDRADRERETAEEDARRAEESRKEEKRKAKEAQENAERYKQEGERDRQKAEESAERERAAQEEAKRVKERAEEAAAVAKAQQEAAEAAGRVAREEAQKALQDAEEAGRKWREGIQPEVWPTKDELNQTKKRLRYVEGSYHFAVAGISGGGKSSLINALRGVTNGSQFAALTGITETTTEITRYLDPDPSLPFVWYDAPGAGTLSIPGWQYFDQQGLYIFDSIIVLFDNRFTATDIAILQNCARFKIPSYIVRSKSDQNLVNVLKDVRRTYKKDKLSATELHKRAKEIYIKETRQSVERELKKASLPSQRVYMVSQDILCHLRIDKGLGDPDMIDEDGTVDEDVLLANIVDEEELLRDILMNAKDRRPTKQKAASRPADKGMISRMGNMFSSRQNATKSGSVAEHAPPRGVQPDSLLTASHPEQNGSGPVLTGCAEPDDDYVLADAPPPDAVDVDV
ncbi:hypothetical protein HWV62_25152 [Athelia sp. TMB]|nr:hypothetical protein HWV62_25152 [Athelia sp. TMB]